MKSAIFAYLSIALVVAVGYGVLEIALGFFGYHFGGRNLLPRFLLCGFFVIVSGYIFRRNFHETRVQTASGVLAHYLTISSIYWHFSGGNWLEVNFKLDVMALFAITFIPWFFGFWLGALDGQGRKPSWRNTIW